METLLEQSNARSAHQVQSPRPARPRAVARVLIASISLLKASVYAKLATSRLTAALATTMGSLTALKSSINDVRRTN